MSSKPRDHHKTPGKGHTAAQAERLAASELHRIASTFEQRFREGRRILSFEEYLALVAADPLRHGRDATRYVRDMFDHYGEELVQKPWGDQRRFRLFDLPWEQGESAALEPSPDKARRLREAALVGQEELQEKIYRALCNFVQEGRANRLVLMHGPNGSAKSTAAGCILRALEHYSTLDEGCLYRFHWIFPSRKTMRGSIGFGETKAHSAAIKSYAHLADDQIDARLSVEVRDHPLFLIPIHDRIALLRRLYEAAGVHGEEPAEWLISGRLCHKNQQVFEALLSSYKGSLEEVLRHVQVERYFISRRYRVGAVTLGPELSVDAGERQITADRSLAALPSALQATTLFEAVGQLVEASGGVLEFSDLLKRPLEAFRYLQLSLETGEVSLPQQTVQLNTIMIGSANEIHLNAFREHPEFPSFRGRLELLRAPYLRDYSDEQRIYDAQIAPFVTRHVAPHATRAAAQFAVLTRMRKPNAALYSEALRPAISTLSAHEKMTLYALGRVPERLDSDAQKRLKASIRELYHETDAAVDFEGRTGVSPREIRTLLLDAAQHPSYTCLSPFAVLLELDELCTRVSEYDWLREKSLDGGYQDHRAFRQDVHHALLDWIEEDMRSASGLVEEGRYGELFDRYISHVSYWVKGEKIRNAHTGEYAPPDQKMMREVEGLLGVKSNNEDYRRGLISQVAAWAIDHPGEKVVNSVVFAEQMQKLRDAVFSDRKKAISLLVRDMVRILRMRHDAGGARGGEDAVLDEPQKSAEEVLERLKLKGYCEHCALDAGSALLRSRFADLIG